MWFNKIVSVLTLTCFLRVQAIVTDEEYASIPPVYHLDDLDNCLAYGEKALYCAAEIQLSPANPGNSSKEWDIISELITHPNNYRHDKLRHAYCLHLACPELAENITVYQIDNNLLKEDLAECMNRKYSNMGLKTTITDILGCQTIHRKPMDMSDYAAGIFFLIIIALLIGGTLYEGLPRYKSKEEYDRITSTKFGKVASCFSVIRNWERLGSDNIHPDSKTLKVINGMRFVCLLGVVVAHTALIDVAGPVTNSIYVEQVTKYLENMIVVNGHYVIQIFFVMAGWLLSYHFFLINEEIVELKFSFVLIAFVNRYIRLTPAYIAMILFDSTWLRHLYTGPFWFKAVEFESNSCRKNWMANLLYINNFYDYENPCLPQTWYLATDTQLFLVAMVVLMLILKFRRFMKFILGMSLAISVIVPTIITYIFDYDITVRYYPETVITVFMNSPEWHITYTSPFVNFGGYVIGIIFGYLYYITRDKIVLTKKWHVVAVYILTATLPLTVIYIGYPIYQTNEKPHIILSALYAGTAKVIYALGIAIGMFAATQKIGWFIRQIVIWRPFLVIGRLAYCIFLVHGSVIRVRRAIGRRPIYVSATSILFHFFGDYAISLIFAVILCIAMELPISGIQKLFIPQMSKKEAELDNKNVQVVVMSDVLNSDEKLTPM